MSLVQIRLYGFGNEFTDVNSRLTKLTEDEATAVTKNKSFEPMVCAPQQATE
jgi:hypothetical protein